jgi:hypothetical protein
MKTTILDAGRNAAAFWLGSALVTLISIARVAIARLAPIIGTGKRHAYES